MATVRLGGPARWVAAAVLLAAVGAVAAAGGVVKLPVRADREVVIETDDPDVEVVAKGDRIVRVRDPKTGREYVLDRADLTLAQTDGDGLQVTADASAEIVVDGETVDGTVSVYAQESMTPSTVRFDDRRTAFVIGPDFKGRFALRVWDAEAATEGARALGIAFQLTNFLRDVGEDLDRGRIYLPRDELSAHGVDPELRRRRVDDAWRSFCRFQIERMRSLYGCADRAIVLLPPRSAQAIRAARVLYSEILDQIERNDFDVFSTRVRVPTRRKLAVVARQRLSS